MPADKSLTRARLKTPNAAAIAGLLFSILLIAAFGLLRISLPVDRQEPGSWLRSNSKTVALISFLLLELPSFGLSACEPTVNLATR